MAEKRRGLGRGLGALIPNNTTPVVTASDVAEKEAEKKVAATRKPQQEEQAAASSAKRPKTRNVKPEPQKKSAPKKEPSATTKRTEQQENRISSSQKATDPKPQESSAEVRKSSGSSKPQKASVAKMPSLKAPAVKVGEKKEESVHVSSASSSASHSEQKSDVSRETLSQPREVQKKKPRMDMGAALRNTTLTRRPVDFFFGEETKEAEEEGNSNLVPVPGAQFAEIKVSDIHPNRKQPRVDFDEQDMAELIHSVREIGVLQPIVVRPSREKNAEKYELVMGERRWRATQAAGLETIPAIIRDTQDIDLLRDALLENLHRSQLNPIEEAAAYQQLMEEFSTTQEQLAKRIGRSRPQISNTIRLLRLPPLVQRRVAAGVIAAGHARALLTLTDQAKIETIAQKIVNEGLSVRAVEELVAHASEAPAEKERKTPQPQKHHERLDYIADAFADKLDTLVKISLGARKGKMTIEFANVEDLNRIIRVLDSDFKGS